MMHAVTNDARYKPGIEMIAVCHNLEMENASLRAEVKRLTVLVDMYQHCQDRDAEDRAARLEDMQREYEMQRQRELEEAVAGQEKYLHRDYTGDKYLRRIYGAPRPGTREWE